MLNNTVYGDLSEKVEISLQTGRFQWQTQSAHDYGGIVELSNAPIRIPVQLDEGFVFREPGEYRVRVTTDRLTQGNKLGGGRVLPITTNAMVIHVEEMPAGEEAARLREIRDALANSHDSGNRARMEAVRNLACLQSEVEVADVLDEVDNPDAAELMQLDHAIAVHFKLGTRPGEEGTLPLRFEDMSEQLESSICERAYQRLLIQNLRGE
jgi:hypothetical protein